MRKILIALASLVVVIALAVGAIGWHFSGKVLAVEVDLPKQARVINAGAGEITFARADHVTAKGEWGLEWDGGTATAGAIKHADKTTVTRELRDLKGSNPIGVINWERNIWNGNPKATVGIDYKDVSVHSDIGKFPAWLVPGDNTWVITIHGRGGERDTAVRVMPALHRAGHTVLAISYRNDRDAPKSPTGKDHLGDTEWRDVDAAITYARENGAKSVVLYGWSKGGGMAVTTLRRSQQGDIIKGLVLDAPVLDWRQTLEFQGKKRNLPAPLISVAAKMTEIRGDFDFDELNHVKYSPSLQIPALVFHGESDEMVPVGISKNFAQRNPSNVELQLYPNALHNAEWNADPARYERELLNFMSRLSDSSLPTSQQQEQFQGS